MTIMTQPVEAEYTYEQPPYARGDSIEVESEALPTPNEIQAALEWGIEKEAELFGPLRYAIQTDWVDLGNNIRYIEGDEFQDVWIRQAQSSPTLDRVREVAANLYYDAVENVGNRNGYEGSVVQINDEHKSEQKQAAKKRGVRALGGAAVGSLAALSENWAVLSMQPANVFVWGASVLALYESASWARRAIELARQRGGDLGSLENPPMPDGAEKSWQKLRPVFEEIAKVYDSDARDGDVLVSNSPYEMSLKTMRKKLELPGGPSLEDYEPVLQYLSTKKNGKHTNHRELYPFNIVRKMISETSGEIFDETFIATLARLSDARKALEDKVIDIEDYLDMGRLDNEQKEIVEQLERDKITLEHTVGLSLLQLFKLKLEYKSLESGSDNESDEIIVDPFSEADPLSVIPSWEQLP